MCVPVCVCGGGRVCGGGDLLFHWLKERLVVFVEYFMESKRIFTTPPQTPGDGG